MSQTETIYAKGLFAKPRLDSAPDFLICRLSFHEDSFAQWLAENVNEKGYVNVDILKGKDQTKLTAKKNTYVPKPKTDDNPF